MIPVWVYVAVDSEIRDPRDCVSTSYDGIDIHFLPGTNEFCDVVAVLAQDESEVPRVRLSVNRFLSALAWKDGTRFITLGSAYAGAPPESHGVPQRGYQEPRVSPYGSRSKLDFDHVQNPIDPRAKLALALFREGLNAWNPFYRFLSFFKIINILRRDGQSQISWVNAHLGLVRGLFSARRLAELKALHADLGDYLYRQGRCAIAHSFDPTQLRDPDDSTDFLEIRLDSDLMQELAEICVEKELGVPSMRTIYQNHLYELEGFRRLLGADLTSRLCAAESVGVAEIAAIPHLSIRIKGRPSYQAFEKRRFKVAECRDGRVTLATAPEDGAVSLRLILDVPGERLFLPLESVGVNPNHAAYTRAVEATLLRFLLDYFLNGALQVFDADNGERLSLKDPYIPKAAEVRMNQGRWEQRLRELEG